MQENSNPIKPVSVNKKLHAKWMTGQLTLLSPPDTARMLPVIDQLTCQTTSLNLCSICGSHELLLPSFIQMITRQSYNNQMSYSQSVQIPTVLQQHVSFTLHSDDHSTKCFINRSSRSPQSYNNQMSHSQVIQTITQQSYNQMSHS